jgi:endonuclease NucS-like protein
MNLLIPYIKLPDHNDPLFKEFTYGDVGQRARKLKTLKEGDHLFFHTTIRGRKYIKAYYTVSRALDTKVVVKDPDLSSKYKNPHIVDWPWNESDYRDNVIVFGDPITSKVLTKPLPFDKKLAGRLSLNIPFPKERTETQAIGSATRSWRRLTNKDLRILRSAIKQWEQTTEEGDTPISLEGMLTTEEVSQVVEKHIEGLLERNPGLLGHPGAKVKGRQVETDEGRIDLLLEKKSGHIIVVEVKLHRIGRDAVKQLRNYMNWVRKGRPKQSVSGVIVCEGVLPAFADDVAKLKDIKVMRYGWQLKLRQWP